MVTRQADLRQMTYVCDIEMSRRQMVEDGDLPD